MPGREVDQVYKKKCGVGLNVYDLFISGTADTVKSTIYKENQNVLNM